MTLGDSINLSAAQDLSRPVPGRGALRGISRVVAQIKNPVFRGCAFLNATVECSDADHPVHHKVLAHRAWFLQLVTGILQPSGNAPSNRSAEGPLSGTRGRMPTPRAGCG